jgi:LysM repeat protein
MIKGANLSRTRWTWFKQFIVFLILPAVVLPLTVQPAFHPAIAKPLLQGADVIALVNALRAANGLPPYRVNASLMAAAQSHSDWQAANSDTSHTGANGSTAKDRAIAAGYGGGAVIFISENIASGANMTPGVAVEIWQSDSLHLNTMLSPNYTDVGAGVASNGKTTYITLDVGYIAGQAGNGSARATTAALSTAGAAPSPTPKPSKGFVVMPVATVTPQADGSIIHVVQPGEVLLNIAIAYNIKLSELYKLNYLNDKSVIYPGQKLKIKGPDPTATATMTATATRIPTATRRPTRTPTPTASLAPTGLLSTETPNSITAPSPSGVDPLLISIIILLIVGGGLVILGSLMKRK